jgi:hypothetical protein
MTPGNDTSGQPMRLRANRLVVETKCLTCNNAFAFSEEVCACPQCGGYHHARCWDDSRGCSHGLGAQAPAGYPLPVTSYSAPPPPPPPPQYGGMPPPPQFAPQMPAPDEHFCPGCRNIVKIGALRCRFCNYNFSFMPGMSGPTMFMNQPPPYGGAFPNFGAPYGLQFGLKERASGARTCGLISVILFGGVFLIIFLLATMDAREPAGRIIGSFSGLSFIASLVLAIVAVVRGHGARRLLEQFPLDYSVRGKATAGIVMGWIVIGLFSLLLVIGLVAVAANIR